jgi:Ca2+-transporting ATPase|tara:strand:+ start:14443 stop:17019 length:2577 start_codon:yes stop_codon:yes gene_type:complete
MKSHNKDIKEILDELNTSEKGLTNAEVNRRIKKFGYNEIEEKKKINPLTIFISQFKNFLVGILIVAVVVSLLVNEYLDAIVIAAILILNAVLGFIQEYRAEKSIEALKKLAPQKARVIRDSKIQEILAKFLVPGDIIELSAGDKVPGDSRLISLIDLATQEASLTGESNPISKSIQKLKENIQIADMKNMIFSSTDVVRGKARAVVTSTGNNTEIGKIAKLIEAVEVEQTPLQKQLSVLGKFLAILTVIITIIVFITGVLKGGPIVEILITSIALAVAAVPEGLPTVVTISLALGVRRMVKRNSLIRKLPSVETLGETSVICSDKTGTLTMNEMTVTKLYVNNKIIDITGSGYKTEGKFSENPKNFLLLLRIGVLCNNSSIDKKIIGDPTEASLLVSAAKAKFSKEQLQRQFPRLQEIPFSSERKMMSTINQVGNKKMMHTKGSPEKIIKLCTKILVNGRVTHLTNKKKKEILKVNDGLASKALRILAFAYKENNSKENNLIFVGLQGMIDPPRKEVKDSINLCKKAGIKVIMITGDHKLTAVAIANQLGIEGDVLTGQELDKTNLNSIVNKVAIYARVNPIHKNKIVEALQKKKNIVAMTGDGVNDAPALKKADIGIAMGIKGSDVSKEASDMILVDDDFSSIVNAIEEGRGIYDNIRKFVNYLLSSNFGEILVIFSASLMGWPLPLVAIQLLWINLITDGLPALALGVDPSSKDIMNEKPRKKEVPIIDKEMKFNILFIGALIAIGTLFLFNRSLSNGLIYARTIAFTSLVVFEIFRLQMVRSRSHTGMFSNKYLVLAVLLSISLQLLVIYTPLSSVFHTTAIQLMDWAYIIGIGVVIYVIGMGIRIIGNRVMIKS